MTHDRSALGPTDVTDEQLAAMLAKLFDRAADEVTLLDSFASEVAYDLPAITTAGRYWVRGHVEVGDEPRPFGLFVKHVQSWARSPLFADIPPEIADMAEAMVPWRTEPLVYRSDLGDRLPRGLSMPRPLGVFDLDEKSATVWLEEVPVQPVTWDLARYERAAYLLGRFAASPAVAECALVGEHPFTVRDYLNGRLVHQVFPMLRREALWHHPLVAGSFDADLRSALLRTVDHAADMVDELAAMPHLTGHGDACPNNLLVVDEDDGFVVIDFGFMTRLPAGFDLGQLLVGDVQVGRLPSSALPEVEQIIVPAYVEGLRAEGCDIPASVVRRAHALHLMVFVGLSTMPFEILEERVTPELHQVAAERAAIARFSLELFEQSQPVR